MSIPMGQLVRWLLSGAGFVAVVMQSGCAARTAPPPAAVEAPPPAPVAAVFEGPAPQVNLFGEVDDQPIAAAQFSGETALQQHTWNDEGFDTGVAACPDGQWLVFASTRHSAHADIYLKRVDGISVTQLTSDPADDAYPVFSPDGKSIAFASNRGGSWDIYLMDADGRSITQITSTAAQEIHPSFSPCGSRLVYAAMGGRSGQWEMWTVDLGTLQRRMIGYGMAPRWSPDAKADRIVFQRPRQRGSRWYSIWTLDLVDGEARRQTEIAVSSNAALVSPSWSPDGRSIAFATILDPSSAAGAATQDIWVVDADGGNRRRLTSGGVNASPYWAAAGRVYFISDRGGVESVWSTSAGDSAFVRAAAGEVVGAADAAPASH